MKKIITIGIVVFFLNMINLTAQDTTHMLIKLRRPEYIGLYVAPEIQAGQLNGSFTPIGGMSAMLLINRKWGLGVTAFGSINRSFSPKDIAPLYLRAHMEGIRLEYTPNPLAAVHLNFPLVIGMGIAHSDSLKNEFDDFHIRFDDNNRGRKRNGWFIVQPGIQLEANMIRFIKFFAGANYRVAFKSERITLPGNTLSGLSLNLGLKLGLFDYRIGKKV